MTLRDTIEKIARITKSCSLGSQKSKNATKASLVLTSNSIRKMKTIQKSKTTYFLKFGLSRTGRTFLPSRSHWSSER